MERRYHYVYSSDPDECYARDGECCKIIREVSRYATMSSSGWPIYCDEGFSVVSAN